MTEHSSKFREIAQNPFVVESPEKLSAAEIVELFEPKFTKIDSLSQRKHTFTWGARGSGKSMMARFLEPRCQTIVHGKFSAIFEQPSPFLAVYCPIKEGHINRTELDLLSESTATTISEHSLVLLIVDRFISCLSRQFPEGFINKAQVASFVENVARLFDRASIATSVAAANEAESIDSSPLEWLREVVRTEKSNVAKFLRDTSMHGDSTMYSGATSGYHDFLLPMFTRFCEIPAMKNVAVYILLDDMDRLARPQQSIVNEWVANRDNAIICLKIFSRRDHYKTMVTRSGSTLEHPHDYSEVDVEELYTRSKSDYWQKVKLISNRRLKVAGVPENDIDVFLPPNAREAELFTKIKEKTFKEWEDSGRPGRRGDYVNRYAIPRLFQHLAATKKRKSYAGFDNLVDISSGVIRDFLEPCYLMFDRLVSRGMKPGEIKQIPSKDQDKVIFHYSEDFLLNRIKDIRKELPPEEWGRLDSLRCLVESLGRLFFRRLHDAKSKEARVFSITVRGKIDTDLAAILRLGVTYRYFQERTYSSKEGGGRESWFILSRRLCPMYKLDPSGFEGRISLTNSMLRLACTNTSEFVNRRLRLATDLEASPSLFDEIEQND